MCTFSEFLIFINMRNKEQRAKYLQENKSRIAAQKKVYYEANKHKLLEAQKQWQAENKDKIRAYYHKKCGSDIMFKFKRNVKSIVLGSIKNNGFKKTSRTEQILGCTYQEFRTYLESKFESWMNWDNRGLYNGEPNFGWDIDHIIPLASAANELELIKLNHYTNLQPLCSYTNRVIKRDKV